MRQDREHDRSRRQAQRLDAAIRAAVTRLVPVSRSRRTSSRSGHTGCSLTGSSPSSWSSQPRQWGIAASSSANRARRTVAGAGVSPTVPSAGQPCSRSRRNHLPPYDAGQVTGTAQLADGTAHAFLWERGTMTDLNARIPAGGGWVLNTALGINAAGQIAGVGTLGGQPRGYLLTPAAMPGLPNTGAGGRWTAPPPAGLLGALGLVLLLGSIALRSGRRRSPMR